ncbi:MAG: hypothetical protein ACC726_08175 [Chloroflexota bacterium]
MPTTTIDLDVRSTATTGDAMLMGASSHVHDSVDALGPITFARPIVIPADEAWYWTDEWQRGELEALASLAMGDGHLFHSVDELIAWLESDD